MRGISELQKFSVLKKALSRDCLARIEAYTDSEESFASAMNLLQAFYGATGFACAATVILLTLALVASLSAAYASRGATRTSMVKAQP